MDDLLCCIALGLVLAGAWLALAVHRPDPAPGGPPYDRR